MTEYFKIGQLVAAFGLKGELILKHELGKRSSLKGLQAVFTEERKGSFIPWFIQSARARSADEVCLMLESIDAREKAVTMIRKSLWVPEADFKKLSAISAPAGLLGYTIINANQPLGKILEVIEQPHQLICRIEINNKEVLVPLNETFLKKIDHKKKQVSMELPDGLLDIYLQ